MIFVKLLYHNLALHIYLFIYRNCTYLFTLRNIFPQVGQEQMN